MKLTTKGRYAVTAMVDLVMHQATGPVALADIAKRQDLSLSYLEQLFGKLRKNQLVESVRGPGGGYLLARDAAKISVAQIITAIDESVDVTKCGGAENCQSGKQCLTHDLWEGLNRVIFQFLNGIHLDGLTSPKQFKTNEDQCITWHGKRDS